MTIKQAIDALEQILKRTSEEYITKRLKNIIEDLSDFMKSPSVGEEYKINQFITELIEDKNTRLENVTRSWVNTMYYSILNMFRFERCNEYYNKNKHEIDGETVSKWITIISAIIGVVFACAAIAMNGFQINDGIDFDKWGFIITFSGGVVAIVIFSITAIINFVLKKKHDKNNMHPYSVDELLAVKYADKPKRLWWLSPTARKMRDFQIAIGDNNKQIKVRTQKAKTINN